jgi:cellulose 1,4-beta-cellobiosidase
VLVLACGLAVALAGRAGAATGCTVSYEARQWPGGFTADIAVTNHAGPLDGWQVDWDYPAAGQRVEHAWNADVRQAGQHVTVQHLAWNRHVAQDVPVRMGLQGSWTGSNPAPLSFRLNGVTCTGPVNSPSASPSGSAGEGDAHVANPYVGVRGYVNPEWKANAEREPGGARVSSYPTGVWLDRVEKIAGTADRMGLRAHLDAALAQGAGYVQLVINDLPGRDCDRLFSTGDFALDELARYKAEFIDPIAAIESDPKYGRLRIVNVVEVNAIPNLVLSAYTYQCTEAVANGVHQQAIRYALDKLHVRANVYTYLPAGHHGSIGWERWFEDSTDLFAALARSTVAGYASVDGFITNTADYSALDEPYFEPNTMVGGQSVRQSRWVDWNPFVDELSFAEALRQKLISKGFDPGIGMLIDTSRNGWGGSARPTGPPTTTELNTFVDRARIDRRYHTGNWCNQAGAGLGERPAATPAPGIDAYVWMKPPGESDGSSDPLHPDDASRAMQPMCDPTYAGNTRNSYNPTGAMPLAPPAGTWFPAAFRQLMTNAYPPLP